MTTSDEQARRSDTHRLARLRAVAQAWGRWWLLVAALLGAVVAIVALPIASTDGRVGPGRVSVGAGWSFEGATAFVVPPLGRVEADTHSMPLSVRATVEELDLRAVERLVSEDQPVERLQKAAQRDFEPLLRRFGIRALVIALVAGGLVGALLPRRRWNQIAIGAGAGVLAVAALLGSTWGTFSVDAFSEPRLIGPLERAPDVIAGVQREAENLEGVRDRVRAFSGQLAELYAAAASTNAGPPGDEVRVLHVSDIHLNPLGIEIVADLAGEFDVAAVLDTGDFTTFGFPIESRFGELVAGVPVPYLLVPGNHDSPANRGRLDALPNLTVVDGIVEIDGLRVLGVADPTFTASGEVSGTEADEERLRAAPDVAEQVRALEPDVLAVHDLRLARESFGLTPLIVSGHTHKRAERVRDGTLALTVGSTGASGLEAFTVETSEPYEAQLLHFVDGRLVSVDYLEIEGISGEFRLDRRVFVEAPREERAPGSTTTLTTSTTSTSTTTTTTGPPTAS